MTYQSVKQSFVLAVLASFAFAYQAPVTAQDIQPQNVLVVYNSLAAGSSEVLHAYIQAHPTLPPENIFDVNSATLAGVESVTYDAFVNQIRNPIRDYLNAAGTPAPTQIISILILRPFPHRIRDTDSPFVCDNVTLVGNEFLGGDATCASVDADLVLLWQNLENGEAGGTLDSLADNFIDNPYHRLSQPIAPIPRAAIQNPVPFNTLENVAYVNLPGFMGLTPGKMYLVCRIDGNNTDDAIASIARAQNLVANKAIHSILLDEWDTVAAGDELDDDPLLTSGDPFNSGDDYELTDNALSNAGWDVIYDNTFDFILGNEITASILGYASYGENHSIAGNGENPPGDGTYIETFTFPRGAIFNTIESFNARALNGNVTFFSQEQVADFIGAGGTFAVGHVWEPFSFTIADNQYLMGNMLLNGRQWAEAAYQAIPVLSWHHVVLGDPLAKFKVLDDAGLPAGDLDGDGDIDSIDTSLFVSLVFGEYEAYNTAFPMLDPYLRGDFNGDFKFDGRDVQGFTNAFIAGP